MTDHPGITVVRRPGETSPAWDGLAALPAAYHLRTEAEKGRPVAGPDGLPHRYRSEVGDPRTAFVGDVVLVAP
ncbi:GNAT family N-acetyltransferase, partial [Streptomyces sp. NPDC055962]